MKRVVETGNAVALTSFDKIWNDHVVEDLGDGAFLIHIDRHFLHELSGALSLQAIDKRGLAIRNPGMTFGTVDHVVETLPGRGMTTRMPGGDEFLHEFSTRIRQHRLSFFDLQDERQGIVHVVAPDLGIALPGLTFVCGDSHTCTVGGVGAFAWGVGTSDGEHILATQTIVQTKPKRMRVNFDGQLSRGVSAKDMALKMIGRYGTAGGAGYAIEFAGRAIRSLGIAGRMTLCNMAAEFGARTGMVPADDMTFEYLEGREFAPKGLEWDCAVAYWRGLATDEDASFDTEFQIDCFDLSPQITWGTSPEHVIGIDERIPDPSDQNDTVGRKSRERALSYAGLTPGDQLIDTPIDGVFLGSCTNSRIDDLRAAANVLKGRKVADGLMAICSPGSTAVKAAAEAEGLDRIFIDAGFQWRESGCSLCVSGSAGGEAFAAGSRVVVSTNRNFEGRQGPHVRSHLASPATLAASAIAGRIADARRMVY